jgi:hypothetical protein
MCSGVPIRRHVARLPFIARMVKKAGATKAEPVRVLRVARLLRRSAAEHRNSWHRHKEGRNESERKNSDGRNSCGALPVFGAMQRKAVVADDPYAPLALYDGTWDSTTTIGEKESVRIENHCARTGLFFVCEQMLKGKTGSLAVFLPVTKMACGGEAFGGRKRPRRVEQADH